MSRSDISSRKNLYSTLLLLAYAVSGTCNTILAKCIDTTVALERRFYHPFIQVCFTYLGESICFALLILISKQDSGRGQEADPTTYPVVGIQANLLILLIPTALDYLSTTLNYLSLSMTSPSSYQMLRGSLIVFASMLSVGFLGRSLNWREWLGIALVASGTVLVGLSDSFSVNTLDTVKDVNRITSGDLIVVISQTMKAVQLTLEESFMRKYDFSPLVLTSTEGIFGLALSAIVIVAAYFIRVPQYMTGDPEQRLENIKDAFYQAVDQSALFGLILCFILSSAVSGMTSAAITKRFGTTTRVICDSSRAFGVSFNLHRRTSRLRTNTEQVFDYNTQQFYSEQAVSWSWQLSSSRIGGSYLLQLNDIIFLVTVPLLQKKQKCKIRSVDKTKELKEDLLQCGAFDQRLFKEGSRNDLEQYPDWLSASNRLLHT
uniref:EamA domain-containing protein n=1 Tax=Trichuris muris TaxID=70415 RepID=A0A5S6QJK8_TRIMR